ncbi:MAG: DUF1549 domain-containing protein [Myxococcota bacterium]
MRFCLVLLAASLCLPLAAEAQDNMCKLPPAEVVKPAVPISPTRELRRITLSLLGTTPTPAQYQTLLDASTDAERRRLLDQAIDDALAAPRFYEKLVEFGHDWVAIGEYTTGAEGDAYQGSMAGTLYTCGASSAHPGAYFSAYELGDRDSSPVCNDTSVPVASVEPWWAPGTTVTVIGGVATSSATYVDRVGMTRDCGVAFGGYYDPGVGSGCSCGPNLTWCVPFAGLQAGSSASPSLQRRHPWDEPARLFAHLVWHDRPLSDLILGNYSVGNNMLRALYVRMGRQTGDAATDNLQWWKPAADTSPRDPLSTDPNDPGAWREFVVETLNPTLLSLTPGKTASGDIARTYRFDPRMTTQAPTGMPAAGVLTMMGSMSSYPRERVRAARWLETFACHEFQPPPAEIHFPPYSGDPATTGPCQHCHRTIDPAAIFFKRWDFGLAYYVPWPFIPGLGPNRVTAVQLSGQYPYNGLPYARWKDSFKPGTVLTPITMDQLRANPETIFLDTLDANTTLLGTAGDGTVGPLGFAKILVRSGEFDRCASRRLFERYVGRPLDPGKEAGYIDALAQRFVAGGRQVRPFIRELMRSDVFRRGF